MQIVKTTIDLVQRCQAGKLVIIFNTMHTMHTSEAKILLLLLFCGLLFKLSEL